MKKIGYLICILTFVVCLAGCNKAHPSANNIPSDITPSAQDNKPTASAQNSDNIILKAPPILTVLYNDISINALNGTSYWEYKNEDGTSVGICSDSMHPLNAKEHMPSFSLAQAQLSEQNPNIAYLQFNVIPDEVIVHCWSEEYWGQSDAEREEIPVKILMIDSNTEIAPIITIELKDGNYIYEVCGKWDSSDKYNGTALYSFYTVKSTNDNLPVERNN